jgi:hypothetical protein
MSVDELAGTMHICSVLDFNGSYMFLEGNLI